MTPAMRLKAARDALDRFFGPAWVETAGAILVDFTVHDEWVEQVWSTRKGGRMCVRVGLLRAGDDEWGESVDISVSTVRSRQSDEG